MTLAVSVNHYYWMCVNLSHYPVHLGIRGQDAWFQFRQVVDPVTLAIMDNPYFEEDGAKKCP